MGVRVPKGGDGGRLRTGCAAKGETARWGIGYGDGCLRVGSAPRDVRPWNLLEEPDLFRAQPGPVLVQQPARRGVGVEAIVKVPALMSGQPANHRLLEIGVMIVGEQTAEATHHQRLARELRHESEASPPDCGHVVREVAGLVGVDHVLRGWRDVRGVHELRHVGEPDWRLMHAHQILTWRHLIPRARLPGDGARPLHHDQPVRA